MISAGEQNKARKKKNGEYLDFILNWVDRGDLTEKMISEWSEGAKLEALWGSALQAEETGEKALR